MFTRQEPRDRELKCFFKAGPKLSVDFCPVNHLT